MSSQRSSRSNTPTDISNIAMQGSEHHFSDFESSPAISPDEQASNPRNVTFKSSKRFF